MLRDEYGRTVAMIAARYGYISTLPPRWEHNPTLRDYDGCTVAMYVARYGDIPTLSK